MIFAGDLWQLPPVRATAIFSNPCVQGYSLEVQRIFKMFWQEGEDAIQRTFQLTQSTRTCDPWLIAVLDADRNGEESWEMYCFTHGLPTRNCGSWMPQSEGPSCGNHTVRNSPRRSGQPCRNYLGGEDSRNNVKFVFRSVADDTA